MTQEREREHALWLQQWAKQLAPPTAAQEEQLNAHARYLEDLLYQPGSAPAAKRPRWLTYSTPAELHSPEVTAAFQEPELPM